MFAASETASI